MGSPDTVRMIPTANASFLSDLAAFLQFEDADRFSEQFNGFVQSGGTHAAGAGLTKSPSALVAYPSGIRITENGSITYPNASTVWVIAHKDTTSSVASWTRVSGTHYLFQVNASQPALPADSVWLMKVVTSGGSVSTVTDYRRTVAQDIHARMESTPKTANYTVATTDRGKHFLFNATSGALTTFLPLAESVGAGFVVGFSKSDNSANGVTISGTSAELINGGISFTLTSQYDHIVVVSDGVSQWFVISKSESSALAQEHSIAGVHNTSFGECELKFVSATEIRLDRFKGRVITINGNQEIIPAAGVSKNNVGLSADTNYNVYVFMNSGVMTLELSTTARSTDATTGIEIKTGDFTRTLVGKIRTNASSQFDNSFTKRHVLNWFNRKNLDLVAAFSANGTVSASTYTEIRTEVQLSFLTWGTEAVRAVGNGAYQLSTTEDCYVGIALDVGSTVLTGDVRQTLGPTGTDTHNFSVSGNTIPAEGRHFLTLSGKNTGGTNTITFIGTGSGVCSLHANIRG